jgi:hypothetical protein
MQNYDLSYWAENYVNRIKDNHIEEEPSTRTLRLLEHFEEYFNENTDNPS